MRFIKILWVPQSNAEQNETLKEKSQRNIFKMVFCRQGVLIAQMRKKIRSYITYTFASMIEKRGRCLILPHQHEAKGNRYEITKKFKKYIIHFG